MNVLSQIILLPQNSYQIGWGAFYREKKYQIEKCDDALANSLKSKALLWSSSENQHKADSAAFLV